MVNEKEPTVWLTCPPWLGKVLFQACNELMLQKMTRHLSLGKSCYFVCTCIASVCIFLLVLTTTKPQKKMQDTKRAQLAALSRLYDKLGVQCPKGVSRKVVLPMYEVRLRIYVLLAYIMSCRIKAVHEKLAQETSLYEAYSPAAILTLVEPWIPPHEWIEYVLWVLFGNNL